MREAMTTEPISTRYNAAEQEALLIEFGATGRHDDTEPVGRRQKLAAASLGIGEHTYRKFWRRRVTHVAEAVLDLATTDVDEAGTDLALPEKFVSRPALELRFLELLRADERVIAFAGQPSTGKRTLARRLTSVHRPAGAAVVRLSGSSPEALQDSMIGELERLGVENINFGVPRHTLRALLRSPARPRYALIEETEDAEQARFLAESGTDTTIVLTTTRRLPGVPQVEVAELSPDEATELVTSVLPETTPADAAALASDLGHHVHAILVAAGMIATDGLTVPEFRQGLPRTIADLLDLEGEQPAVTGLYRRIYERLAADARTVLEMLVYLAPDPLPTALAVRTLAQQRRRRGISEAHLRTFTRAALVSLRDHFLIRITDDMITVPHLVRSLVIGLTHSRGHRIAAQARAGVLDIVKLIRADHPDLPALDFVRLVHPLVTHVRASLIDPWKTGSLVEHIYWYGQALGRVLDAAGEPPWRLLVLALETSEASFSIVLTPLPHKADDVDTLKVTIGFADPEPIEIQRTVQDWSNRKRMQLLVITRTMELTDLTAG